jgi:hypothetical protein
MFQTISWSGQNVSNNFVKIFNELYLFSPDLCLTLDILAYLVNAFFLVHDSENPKFGSLNSPACTIMIESKRANFKVKGYNLNYTT